MPISLDHTDRRLLRLVQQDARLSADTLADRIGASRSSVQRRLRRLQNEGVITRDVAVVDPERVDAQMTFVVEVELERERVDLLDDFKRSMLALQEVQQCYYVTGHTDFILIVLADSMQTYERLSRQVFVENPNIRRFATSVVVDRVKTGQYVPVPDPAPAAR